MIFSKRLQLAKDFEEWREEMRRQGNHPDASPFTVITFLQIKGYLREMPEDTPTADPVNIVEAFAEAFNNAIIQTVQAHCDKINSKVPDA